MVLINGLEDFIAFKEAYALAVEIRPLAKAMPQTEQYGGIADQMRRASTGICANISEGIGKNQSKLELRRFIRIALGSANEMDLWLRFAKDFEYIEPALAEGLRQRYSRVCRLLKGFEQSISSGSATPDTRHQNTKTP